MALLIIIIIAAAFFLMTFLMYKLACLVKERVTDLNFVMHGSAKKHYNLSLEYVKQLREKPYEDLYITSYDGLKLHAYLYRGEENAQIDICFHGYNSTPRLEYRGISHMLFDMGHTVVLVDGRSQGISEGKEMTFGFKERHDVHSWTDYICGLFGPEAEICLYGVSMGAATILMSANQPFSGNVRGMVADCPFSSHGQMFRHMTDEIMHIPYICYYFLKIGVRIYGHFSIDENAVCDSVKETDIPILVIHGTDDHLLPCEFSEKIQLVNPQKVERYLIEGAEHGVSCFEDPGKYRQILSDFFGRHFHENA